MKNIAAVVQSKESATRRMISLAEGGMGLEPKNMTVGLSTFMCRMNEDGEVFVMTGTRIKPAGIGIDPAPDLVFIYNEKYGVFVETLMMKRIIKENVSKLKIDIDPNYKVMGVTMSLGLISSYLDEDFVSALPRFYEPG